MFSSITGETQSDHQPASCELAKKRPQTWYTPQDAARSSPYREFPAGIIMEVDATRAERVSTLGNC